MGKLFSKSRAAGDSSGSSSSGGGRGGAKKQPNKPIRQAQVHKEGITTLASSSSAEGRVFSGSQDNSLAVLTALSLAVEARWQGHTRAVTAVAPLDADHALSASRDRSVRLWSVSQPAAPTQQYDAHDVAIMGLAASTDRQLFCSGSRDGVICAWDAERTTPLRTVKVNRNVVTHMAWIAGTKQCVQASEDKTLRVWDTDSLKAVQAYPMQQYILNHCDVSSDGNYLLTCSNGFSGQGCQATLWDRRTTRKVQDFVGHDQSTTSCTFITGLDGGPHHWFATCSRDGTVKLWRSDKTAAVASISCEMGTTLEALCPLAGGDLAVGLSSGRVDVCHVTVDKEGLDWA
eukprot:m.64127 g.64127  ORF g.64127 m.64127 type:complete len:345 (+) comp16406_c0_seq2:65-1099(+)